MANVSEIPPETIQAYRETEFRVELEPSLVLTIDMPNPRLAALCKTNRADSCAFITACNPHGAQLGEADNAKLQEELAQELHRRSLPFLPGIGQHPVGNWPGESSYLVFGLSLEAARTLGRRFDQNAIVWCGPDTVAQLILLR